MPGFFTNQTYPNKNKTVFENYNNHVKSNLTKLKKELKKGDMDALVLGHLLILDELHDKYDFLDEIMGVSALPVLGMIASITFGCLAMLKGLQHCFMCMKFSYEEKEDHLDQCANYLMLAMGTFISSWVSLLKSAISLVLRPALTLINGWKKANETRFKEDDSIEAGLLSL